MKCENCGNDYPSHYYFATPTICKNCFSQLTADEQQKHFAIFNQYIQQNPHLTRIGFGRRLGAALLDIVIFYILFLIIILTSGIYSEINELIPDLLTDPTVFRKIAELITPIAVILSLIYYSFEVFIAATPGKMMLNIQIASDDKTKASISKLFTRFFIKHIEIFLNLIVMATAFEVLNTVSSILQIIIIIGFFFVLSEKKQSFHDMIAKTAVYYRNDLEEVVENKI